MVKLFRFFLYVLFFILALMYFMPKQSIYYFAETELQKYNVVVSHETVNDSGLSLEVSNLDIYAQGIKSATIQELDISLFGLYNSINAKDIKLESVVESMLPLDINEVRVTYSILDPVNVKLESEGAFGSIDGKANIIDRKVVLLLKPSKLMLRKYRTTLRNFKKLKSGEYEYDQNF